jgi:spore germination protein
MLLTTLTATGVPNIEAVYEILINGELQDQYINIVLGLVRSKGYYGVNLSFQYLNSFNQNLYIKLFKKISKIAVNLGIPLFITINPNKTFIDNKLVYEKVDYSSFKQATDNVNFLNFAWGLNYGPPLPISSIDDIKTLVEYTVTSVSPEEISVGIPIIGYDWELPYVAGFSKASALTLKSVIDIARDADAVIEFDEISQTPYIRYNEPPLEIQHIIWFIDARTIRSLTDLVTEYHLSGTGVWNIMVYYPQLWLVINSQYEIEKIIE